MMMIYSNSIPHTTWSCVGKICFILQYGTSPKTLQYSQGWADTFDMVTKRDFLDMEASL